MALDNLSEVTQFYLAILAVILGAMVIGIGPRSRKSRSRTVVPSSEARPELQAEEPPPTTADVFEGLETLVTELRRDTATDENNLQSPAFFKRTIGHSEGPEIQEFIDKLFDTAQKLACLRYLIEHTTGSDRIALGNMKLRTLKQVQTLERELDQLRKKASTPSSEELKGPVTMEASGG